MCATGGTSNPYRTTGAASLHRGRGPGAGVPPTRRRWSAGSRSIIARSRGPATVGGEVDQRLDGQRGRRGERASCLDLAALKRLDRHSRALRR